MQLMVNFILFQIGWFACVISAARQLEWLALLSIGICIAIHLSIVKDRMSELQIILTAGLMGLIIDSTLISLGVFIPEFSIGVGGIAPLWLVGMWMLFGITINHSLRWLNQRYFIAAVMGFVFAPVAYLAGQRLGALTFPSDYPDYISLLAIGSCWIFVTPLLLVSTRYFSQRDLHQNFS